MSLNSQQLHPAGQQAGSTWARITMTALLTVDFMSTANIADLAAASTTMDGGTITEGKVVWLKDQTTGTQNGLHIASDIGATTCVLTRCDPFSLGAPIFPGQKIYVAAGTANGGKEFQFTGTSVKVVGTDALTFAETATAGSQGSVPINIYSFREVSAVGDVGNIAANGGVLASDTTPIMLGDNNNSAEIQWATGNVDPIGTSFMLPSDFDDTADAQLDLIVYSGSTDAATFSVATNWNGGAEVTDSADDSATKSATAHKITVTIATADIPAGSNRVTIRLTPGTHATNTISILGARLNYKRRGVVAS